MFPTHLIGAERVMEKVSQSPRIGSMFPTRTNRIQTKQCINLKVAIPSNRVNVSYIMEFTKSGLKTLKNSPGRNPLESGQCFLHQKTVNLQKREKPQWKSQSPRIGSMFPTPKCGKRTESGPVNWSRNPLESGQCFLQGNSFGCSTNGH